MTKRELNYIKTEVKLFHHNLNWKEGYCCYKKDNLSSEEMITLGNNVGIYGWNWTLFFSEKTMTFYLSGYRNY